MANIALSRAVVGVKAESSAYTFNAPVAGDSYPCFDINVSYSGDNYQRQETRDHFGKFDNIPSGSVSCEIGWKFLLVGSGSAGVAPHWGKTIQACGFSETVSGGVSVTYKPSSTYDATSGRPSQAYSVSVIERDVNNSGGTPCVRYALSGSMGTIKFTCKYGEPVVAEVSFKGAYQTVTDVASITPSGVSTSVPPRFLGSNFLSALGTFNSEFTSITYDIGNELGDIMDANFSATNGFKGSTITNRRPTGTIDPAFVRIATNDFFNQWRLGTTGAMSMSTTIGSAGNAIQINAPRCQYDTLKLADRNGFRSLEAPFSIVTAVAAVDGDEFSIVLT